MGLAGFEPVCHPLMRRLHVPNMLEAHRKARTCRALWVNLRRCRCWKASARCHIEQSIYRAHRMGPYTGLSCKPVISGNAACEGMLARHDVCDLLLLAHWAGSGHLWNGVQMAGADLRLDGLTHLGLSSSSASLGLRISLRIHLLCSVDAGGRFRGMYSSASGCDRLPGMEALGPFGNPTCPPGRSHSDAAWPSQVRTSSQGIGQFSSG